MQEDRQETERLQELLSGIDPAVLQQIMPLAGGVLTMMFTDIVNSAGINQAVGDPVYLPARQRHNELIRECIGRHNGREIKTIGDSFFIGFALPANGVACAVDIQQRLEASRIAAGEHSLKVRIGLHTGTPHVQRDEVSGHIDLLGTEVNKAARVEALAGEGQVLISEQTKSLAGNQRLYDWGWWELKGLGPHRIFEVLWPGKEPTRPAGRARLPAPRYRTRFVGRESELDAIMQAVKDNRLVTLRGLGGVGKTRLADEIEARLDQAFEDGVFFLELAHLKNSLATVVSELVARLEVNTQGFPDEASALLAHVQNRRTLLVLNNFENVMEAAPFVHKLLSHCGGLHCLVTSQTLLGLDGEQHMPVEPMPVPPESSVAPAGLAQLDSFRLFRERARRSKPGWEVDERTAPLVAEILELTDGIPLCLELAAPWVKDISLADLRNGLRKNRTRILQRPGAAASDKRHAGIQACLDWSFNLLSPPEQALLPQLSVFSGGFFAEDVAAICGVQNAAELLQSLQQRSLLSWVESEWQRKTRYLMLPIVKDYAAQKLQNGTELRDRFSDHFLRVLRWAHDLLEGKEQLRGIARISAELENIRAAMDWAVECARHRAVARFSQAFASFLDAKGRFAESLLRSRQGLEAAERIGDPSLVAGHQNNLGAAYQELPTGDRAENLQKAIACYQAALRVFTERDSPREWAGTQINLGNAYANLPTGARAENLEKAIACYQAALRVYTERDFPSDWALTQNNLGLTCAKLLTGDRAQNVQKAIACFRAALRVYTERDFPLGWAMTQNNLGIALTKVPTGNRAENLQRAIGCYQAALRVRTERDFPVDWATTQNNLGGAYFELPSGDRAENLQKAIACAQAALRVYTERDFPRAWAETQSNLGNAYAELPSGDRAESLQKAIACFQAALRVRTERDFPRESAMTQDNLGNAYANLPTGNRAENLQKAIACFEAAARGYSACGLEEEARRSREAAERLKKLLVP